MRIQGAFILELFQKIKKYSKHILKKKNYPKPKPRHYNKRNYRQISQINMKYLHKIVANYSQKYIKIIIQHKQFIFIPRNTRMILENQQYTTLTK